MLPALVIAASLIAQVEASTPADLTSEVQRLLKKLDAPEADARGAAEEELIRLGPKVVELLPTGDDNSAQVRERLARIRQHFDDERAAEQLQTGSTVTVSGTLSLEEVRAAIEKQTGNKIADYRGKLGQSVSNLQLKLDIKDAPFWPALDAVLDSAQLGIYPFSGDDGLAIAGRSPSELPRRDRGAYAGPLRIEATRLVSERHPGTSDSAALAVSLEIAWEPRLKPISFEQPLAKIQAVDDQGEELFVERPAQREERSLQVSATGGGTAVEMMIPFSAPPRAAAKIASLKGTLNALIAGKTEAFKFEKLSDAAKAGFKPLPQRIADATVVLDGVKKNNDIWEVAIRVRYATGGKMLAGNRGWILQNDAFLTSADGQRIEKAGSHSSVVGEDEFGVTYQFDVSDVEGCTFVYKTPSSIQSIPLEYELKNLPLP
jgi:hypothetical protein